MRGGFEIRDSFGLELIDVSMHCFALTWGLPVGGDVTIKRFRGCRRPGTNRLMGGGFIAFGMFGGCLLLDDCEFGHNFDDASDIGSELGFAFKQVVNLAFAPSLGPQLSQFLKFSSTASFSYFLPSASFPWNILPGIISSLGPDSAVRSV